MSITRGNTAFKKVRYNKCELFLSWIKSLSPDVFRPTNWQIKIKALFFNLIKHLSDDVTVSYFFFTLNIMLYLAVMFRIITKEHLQFYNVLRILNK